jgi:hypothetical protein
MTNEDTNPPELNNEFIHKNAENKARKFVQRLWELLDKDEKIQLQHSNQRFELEIIVYEMERHRDLRDGFEAKKSWLQSELTRISGKIKESKDGLSIWEGGKLTFPKGSQILLEFIGKAALSYVTVSSISVILSPNDIKVLQEDDVKNIFKEISFAFWFAVLAGISLVELIAASVYNWFTSETGHHSENDETKDLKWNTNLSLKTNIKNLILRLFIWIRPIHLLLLFIIIVEAFMGSKILFPILQNALKKGGGLLEQKPIESNSWDVFLAISVFALVNITFAISKAKRDKAIVGTHNQLYKYLEHSERIKQEIKFCNEEAKNADKKFEYYFKKFQEMLDISQQKGLNWINRNTTN